MTKRARLIIKRAGAGGHAMIELALSAGVMIACLAGTFQFGYTFYVYDELVSAVGSGARLRPRPVAQL